MHRTVYFWRGLYPLLRRFCREKNVSFNKVVNCAVEGFLGRVDVEELRLTAKLEQLLREEAGLRRVSNAMLRSGSYLSGYVQRVLLEPGRSISHLPDPQRPLKALNPKEERVFRRIATRREQIAQEIAEIQEQLLRDVKPFRLKPICIGVQGHVHVQKPQRKEVKMRMPVKRLGRPPFLSVNEVEDGDVFLIVEPPYLVDAEHSKWGKERYRIVVKKPEDREFGLRTWTLNTSTSNRLLDAFGEDDKLWVGKKIRVRKHAEFVLGKQKLVLYGEAYVDPQKPF